MSKIKENFKLSYEAKCQKLLKQVQKKSNKNLQHLEMQKLAAINRQRNKIDDKADPQMALLTFQMDQRSDISYNHVSANKSKSMSEASRSQSLLKSKKTAIFNTNQM